MNANFIQFPYNNNTKKNNFIIILINLNFCIFKSRLSLICNIIVVFILWVCLRNAFIKGQFIFSISFNSTQFCLCSRFNTRKSAFTLNQLPAKFSKMDKMTTRSLLHYVEISSAGLDKYNNVWNLQRERAAVSTTKQVLCVQFTK